MLHHVRLRTLTEGSERLARLAGSGRPHTNFTFAYGHDPSDGDPFSPLAPHHLRTSADALELFRGELIGEGATCAVGRVREPSWLLLSCGVVMRSHVCLEDGSRYMTFPEAKRAVPAMVTRFSETRARNAWNTLVSDLELMDVPPVPGEPVVDAHMIWRNGRPRGDGVDGQAALGERSTLDGLVTRLLAGDAAAADEWREAYTALGNWQPPRAAREREMPAPSLAEQLGPHTRYILPPKDGLGVVMERGRAPPRPTSAEANILARHAAQDWRIADSGRSIFCTRGSHVSEASTLVQLYARAIPIVTSAYDELQKAKARQRQRVCDVCARKGTVPSPDKLTDEEQSWEGGPGYNVALARATLREILRAEGAQGFPFTAAAVGDGSWHKQRCLVSRAALLHDGTILGGAVDMAGPIGGDRNNYDGELAHRVDVLAHLQGGRLFYAYDSTSPVTAAEHFRRSTTGARARAECDDWQGSAMAFEHNQEVLVYWWFRSHRGQLLEGAADALAKQMLGTDVVPVPQAYSRHVSLRFYAKASERELMLAAAGLALVRKELKLGDAMRATRDDYDALRAARLNERDTLYVRRLREDQARLQVSRAYPNTGCDSAGAFLFAAGCPCGGGQQDRHHLLWKCSLPAVARLRLDLHTACRTLDDALGQCEPVTGTHQVSQICSAALKNDTLPMASNRTAAFNSQSMDATAARQAALRHMLGIIRLPDDAGSVRRAARLSGPVLRTVVAMGRAAETASVTATMQMVQRSFLRVHVRAAFIRLDVYAKFRARHPACRTTFCVSPMPVARIARAGTSIRSSRHWELPLPNEITHATAITSPRAAVGLVLAALRDETTAHSRYCRLAELDVRLRSQADAPAVAADSDAGALQIVVDALPAPGDLPVALPRVTRSGAYVMAVPIVDDELRTTLEGERDAAGVRACSLRASPAALADVSFMARWTAFWRSAKSHEARAIRARVRAAREAASAPVSVPDPCAAAAAAARRACALVIKCRRRADEARARARLRVTQHTAPVDSRARPLRCGTGHSGSTSALPPARSIGAVRGGSGCGVWRRRRTRCAGVHPRRQAAASGDRCGAAARGGPASCPVGCRGWQEGRWWWW